MPAVEGVAEDQAAAVPGHLIRLVAPPARTGPPRGRRAGLADQLGPAARRAAAAATRASSVEQALALPPPAGPGWPAAGETSEAAPSAVEACPRSSHAAPVWCVPDPGYRLDRPGPAPERGRHEIGRQAGRWPWPEPWSMPRTPAPRRPGERLEMGLGGPGAPEETPPLGRAPAGRAAALRGRRGDRLGPRGRGRRRGPSLGRIANAVTDVAGAEVIAWKAALSGQSMSHEQLAHPARHGPAGHAGRTPGRSRQASAETVPVTSRAKVIYSAPRGVDTAGPRGWPVRGDWSILRAGVDPQDYESVRELCDLLSTARWAPPARSPTRAGCRAGRPIGITGRSVAPELLVSIGASGGFNHCCRLPPGRRVWPSTATRKRPSSTRRTWASWGTGGRS